MEGEMILVPIINVLLKVVEHEFNVSKFCEINLMLQIRVGMATPKTVPAPQRASPSQEISRAHVRV